MIVGGCGTSPAADRHRAGFLQQSGATGCADGDEFAADNASPVQRHVGAVTVADQAADSDDRDERRPALAQHPVVRRPRRRRPPRSHREDSYDFAPLLAGMKPVIADADAAICHDEVPLAPRGGPYRNYPLFAAPPQVVKAIKATGYDLCTTASNHSLDGGFAGLRRTLDELDQAGIQHAGTYRSRAESERPTIFTTASGIKIGLVSATFSTNGLPLPDRKPWAVTPTDTNVLLRRAHRARQAGADIVLVALHAGTEYSSQENDQQRALARRLTASPDVDLVYGHHAHVVQPWTVMNRKWLVYGLGNTVAQHEPSVVRGYEGVTARFTFTASRTGTFTVTRAEYIPTLTTHYQPGRPARLLRQWGRSWFSLMRSKWSGAQHRGCLLAGYPVKVDLCSPGSRRKNLRCHHDGERIVLKR